MGRLGCAALLLWMSAVAAAADTRVALVIGNGSYQNTAALANPVNDAQDIAAALQRVGFSVMLERNLDKRGMDGAIARFARQAQNADAALFYFAGHGLQHRGLNYLVPVDARLEDEFSLTFELSRVEDVLHVLERARGTKILILDACRNNPLTDRMRWATAARDLATRGLARIEPTHGMITAYATQANQVAVDGTGRNSPFTAALIKEIEQPGVEIGAMFRRVAAEVHRQTQGRQLPEVAVSLFGEFYLNTRETDLQTWSRIRGSNEASAFRDFIRDHPRSVLLPDARDRLAALEREERDRVAERERAERERVEREQAERDRQARAEAERLRLERERLERERLAREQLAREQLARELAERERPEREREARDLAQRERLERERQAREFLERERLEREREARELAERERLERERQARELAEREQAERARVAALEQARRQTEQAAPPPPDRPSTALLPPSAPPPPPPAQPFVAPALAGGALVLEIKKELKRLGCYPGRVDDRWSSGETASSIKRFARHASLAAPDQPSMEFLDALRGKTGRICPLECGAREVEKDGRCVTKTCPSGQRLGGDGKCAAPAKTRTSQQPGGTPSRGSGRRCFTLGGRSFCE